MLKFVIKIFIIYYLYKVKNLIYILNIYNKLNFLLYINNK